MEKKVNMDLEQIQNAINEVVEETTEITAEEALALLNAADGDKIISASGNRFIEFLNRPVKLKFLNAEIIIKDRFSELAPADMPLLEKFQKYGMSLNRTCRYTFADEHNKEFVIDMFYFYWNRDTKKKVDLSYFAGQVRESIFMATKTTTLEKAAGKYMYITASVKRSNSGKEYFTYSISDRK